MKTAKEAIELVNGMEGPSELWAHLTVLLAMHVGGNPLQVLMGLTALHPTAIGPRLVLAQTLKDNGFFNDAERHLRILDALNVVKARLLLREIEGSRA